MRRRLAWIAGAGLLGLMLGLGSAALVVRGGGFGQRSFSGWRSDPRIGSRAADPWTRARVAKSGLLALTRDQTLYFTRYADERGRPLEARCSYLVSGARLPARWWSVTIYAADDYLPRNGQGTYSVDATRAHRDWQGAWRMKVGPERGDAPDWISTRNAGRFSLTLRLYNPEPDAQADFGSVALPTIRTLGCGGRDG